MEPTLSAGDVVLVKMSVTPMVGDVVIAQHPHSGIEIIKRVESISETGVFVRSDNPDDLDVSDSRIFGELSPDLVVGTVVARVPSS